LEIGKWNIENEYLTRTVTHFLILNRYFMKNFVTRIIGICIVVTTFIACSKDNTLQQPGSTASSLSATGKMGPQENGGTVVGTLDPVPTFSAIALVQGQWIYYGETSADQSGHFMLTKIPPLNYDLMIRYKLGNEPEEHVMYVRGVDVHQNQTIDLGTISLK
jgi:hypothetical protein